MKDIWITDVEIVNFQSHSHTKFSLVQGTNALIGDSNSGKSAAIRAIKWCLINNPNGTGFIKTGQEEAVVKVSLSNGKTIERRRARSKVNLYRLYEDGELIDEYTGFGSSVPPAITEAHGIVPIANDIYFQFAHQLEAPFMLSLKPKDRAKVLGNLDELAQIDTALGSTNDDVRVKGKEVKTLEKEEKQLSLEHKQLTLEVERLSQKIKTLKALKEGLQEKEKLRTFLQKQLERLKEINDIGRKLKVEVEKATAIVDHWPKDIEQRIEFFKGMHRRTMRLKEIKEELSAIHFMSDDKLNQIDNARSQIESNIQKFSQMTKMAARLRANKEEYEGLKGSFSTHVASIDYTKLDQDIARYNALFKHLNNLEGIERNVKETETLVRVSIGNIETLLAEFVDLLQQAELCPTCGQETHEVCTKTLEPIL